jgi:hypothetical protein
MTTARVSTGLVISMKMKAPTMVTTERRAVDAVEEMAPRTAATSPLSRAVSSPMRCLSKKAVSRVSRWLNTASRRSASMRSPT